MVIYGKISTIKKINGLDGFLASSKGQHRIFIGDNIAQKAFKQFLDLKRTEVFFDYELLMNIISPRKHSNGLLAKLSPSSKLPLFIREK